MSTNNPYDILTPEEQADLVESYRAKLAKAKLTEEGLLVQLEALRSDILRWERFVKLVALESVLTTEPSKSPIDKDWGYIQTAEFAINNPHLIGKKSIAGNTDILEMLGKYQPSMLEAKPKEELVKRYRGALSTLAWQRKVGKLREKKNKTSVHYIPLAWLEHGKLKPEHQDLLTDLEYIPAKPNGEKAPSEEDDF